MAAEDMNIVRGIFTGEEQPEDEVEDEEGFVWPIILPHVTHLCICQSLSVIPQEQFCCHPNIVELERDAFDRCPRLKRLILPGVEEIKWAAFFECEAIEHIECNKLEIIRQSAFMACKSLESIDLLSAKTVEDLAFEGCDALREVEFGKHLDNLGEGAFGCCTSLERITIPLKNGLFGNDFVFADCDSLKRVDLVEDKIIHKVVDALLMKEWRQDTRNEIDSINQILSNTYTPANATGFDVRKTRSIRDWIDRVLRKIHHYKAQHHSLLNEVATILQLDLPSDTVHNHVLAFLELPSHTFDGEDEYSLA